MWKVNCMWEDSRRALLNRQYLMKIPIMFLLILHLEDLSLEHGSRQYKEDNFGNLQIRNYYSSGNQSRR